MANKTVETIEESAQKRLISRIHTYFQNPSKDLPLELRELRDSLDSFFTDKNWHVGGPVPIELLHTERNYLLLINVEQQEAVDVAFTSIHKAKHLAKTPYAPNCDSELCLRIFRDCDKRHISPRWRGGLWLLYLELCEGVKLYEKKSNSGD